MKNIGIIFLLCALIMACNSSPEQTNRKPTQTVRKDTSQIKPQAKIPEEIARTTEKPVASEVVNPAIDSALLIAYHRLDSLHADVPFYLPTEEERLFIVADKKYAFYENDPETKSLRLGLVDSRNRQMLETEYTTIGNPGIFGDQWIEISKGDLYGLYNLGSGQLIPPQFDYLIPDPERKFVALGKSDDRFTVINKDGKTQMMTNSAEHMQYRGLSRSKIFDANDPLISKFISTVPLKYEMTTYNDYEEGLGMVFTPSYLKTFDKEKVLIRYLFVKGQSADAIVTDEYNYVLDEVVNIAAKIKGFITSFTESGTNARGYLIEKNELKTISQENEVIDSLLLTTNSNSYEPCTNYTYRILADTLIEIVRNVGQFQDYFAYPRYTYYQIDSSGNINQLDTERYFSFTQFTKINSSHFKHCLAKHAEAEPIDESVDQYNVITYEHFSIDELDIMRNEIFAAYGYRFKTDKWQKYFSEKAWYKPLYDNVDHLLTEIDQHNIKVILETKEKMTGNEEAYRKRSAFFFAAPG